MSGESDNALARVRKSPVIIPMGHEELILPMLVWRSSRDDRVHALGTFYHCVNDDVFTPNDMSGTAVAGFTSGCTRDGNTPAVDVRKMFCGLRPRDWEAVPEIHDALAQLGRSYEYFAETSAHPLQDGYIARCRFVAHKLLTPHYLENPIRQEVDAGDVVKAFLAEWEWGPRLPDRGWRGHSLTVDYGDDDCYFTGHAVWIEREGIVRVWTRIVYLPK